MKNPFEKLNLSDWRNSFKEFIEASFKDDKSDSHNNEVIYFPSLNDYKVELLRSVLTQLALLYELKSGTHSYDKLMKLHGVTKEDLRLFFNKFSGDLKEKLIGIKEGRNNLGDEPLKYIKIGNQVAWSIEVYGRHRAVYLHIPQYKRIKLASVFHHYESEPRPGMEMFIFDAELKLAKSNLNRSILNRMSIWYLASIGIHPYF